MFTLMLPQGMVDEFLKIHSAEKPERGTIGARVYALGVMVQKRRATLCELLTIQGQGAYWCDTTAEIVRLNAELTLLMIERGA